MFDVGFGELVLIGLVMLLVLGPERLPKVARTAGLWIGRGRRMLSSVKAEIDQEIKAQELKEILNKQAQGNPLETILDDPVAKAPVDKAKTSAAKTKSASAPAKAPNKSDSATG